MKKLTDDEIDKMIDKELGTSMCEPMTLKEFNEYMEKAKQLCKKL